MGRAPARWASTVLAVADEILRQATPTSELQWEACPDSWCRVGWLVARVTGSALWGRRRADGRRGRVKATARQGCEILRKLRMTIRDAPGLVSLGRTGGGVKATNVENGGEMRAASARGGTDDRSRR